MIELTEEQKQFAAELVEVAIRTKYEEERKDDGIKISQEQLKKVLKVVGIFVGIYIALVFLAAFSGAL